MGISRTTSPAMLVTSLVRTPPPNFQLPADDRAERDMQCSLSDELCRATRKCKVNNKKVLTAKHWHYRIVLGTVGYGLCRFLGTDELLNAAYDVFRGKF